MKRLIFIGIFFLVGCTEGEREISGKLTEEQSAQIKKYITNQISNNITVF